MKLVNLAANFNHKDGSPIDGEVGRIYSIDKAKSSLVDYPPEGEAKRHRDLVVKSDFIRNKGREFFFSVTGVCVTVGWRSKLETTKDNS